MGLNPFRPARNRTLSLTELMKNVVLDEWNTVSTFEGNETGEKTQSELLENTQKRNHSPEEEAILLGKKYARSNCSSPLLRPRKEMLFNTVDNSGPTRKEMLFNTIENSSGTFNKSTGPESKSIAVDNVVEVARELPKPVFLVDPDEIHEDQTRNISDSLGTRHVITPRRRLATYSGDIQDLRKDMAKLRHNRITLDTTLLNALCGLLCFTEGASDTKTETHTQWSTLEHPRWHFLYGRAKQL